MTWNTSRCIREAGVAYVGENLAIERKEQAQNTSGKWFLLLRWNMTTFTHEPVDGAGSAVTFFNVWSYVPLSTWDTSYVGANGFTRVSMLTFQNRVKYVKQKARQPQPRTV